MEGWTSAELTVYQGHLEEPQVLDSPLSPPQPQPGPRRPQLLRCRHHVTCDEQNLVLVRGPSNARSLQQIVNLDHRVQDVLEVTYLSGRLEGSPKATQQFSSRLPLDLDRTNLPWILESENLEQDKLLLQIHCSSKQVQQAQHKVVGVGAIPLNEIGGGSPSRHENLVRDFKISLINTSNASYIGTLCLNILIVKPYSGHRGMVGAHQGFWNCQYRPVVVGHRGRYSVQTRRIPRD